jgi:hypothetical protein
MSKLLRFLGASLLGGLLASTTPALAQDANAVDDPEITLIYVSAWNCPPCTAWAQLYRPKFEQSSLVSQVTFREVEAYNFARIDQDGIWPRDLRWVRDRLKLRHGAPRWIILSEDELISHELGLDGWSRKILPRLRELAG